MVEDFKVPPMNPTDPAVLMKTLNAVDPIGVLGDLGLDKDSALRVFEGDYSPLEKRFYEPKYVDFLKVMTNYGKTLPMEVCLMFFERAKNHKPFTSEELGQYHDVCKRMFDFFFDTCKNMVVKYEEDSECLYIKVLDSCYSLVKIYNQEGISMIIVPISSST
jgi:hypothetical protein